MRQLQSNQQINSLLGSIKDKYTLIEISETMLISFEIFPLKLLFGFYGRNHMFTVRSIEWYGRITAVLKQFECIVKRYCARRNRKWQRRRTIGFWDPMQRLWSVMKIAFLHYFFTDWTDHFRNLRICLRTVLDANFVRSPSSHLNKIFILVNS